MIFHPMDRRRFLALTGLAAAAPLVGAGRTVAAEDGGVLRIRTETDIQRLDPMTLAGNLEEVVNRCVLVTLTRLADMRDGVSYTPYAAETIEQKSPLEIAFTLLPGLKWTNGFGPVTAEDVKFSFERIADPKNESAWRYQFERLKEVEVTGERSGIIRLSEPFEPFWLTTLPYYGGAIVSKAAVSKLGTTIGTEHPAVCGPYVVESWEPKQKIRLAANPDWPGEKPAYAAIELLIVPDDQSAALAYEAKAFDYTRIAVASAKGLKASPPPDTVVVTAQSSRFDWLTINMGNPKLADPRVRQAIQYAYDGDAVIAGSFDGLVARSTGVVQPGSGFERPANLIVRDVAKAAALLEEAGASGLTVELAVLNDTTSTTTAQIIQASLGEAGITVEIRPYDEGAYWTLGDKTQGDGWKTLELVLMSFAGGIDPSENLVWFRPEQIGIWNWSQFDSPEYETLYKAILGEGDHAKRVTMVNRMEDLLEQSGAVIFICHEPFTAMHRTSVAPNVQADGHPNPTMFKPT